MRVTYSSWVPAVNLIVRGDTLHAADRMALRTLLVAELGARDWDLDLLDHPDRFVTALIRSPGSGRFVATSTIFRPVGERPRLDFVVVDRDVRNLGLGSLVVQACRLHLAEVGGDPGLVAVAGPGERRFLERNGFSRIQP